MNVRFCISALYLSGLLMVGCAQPANETPSTPAATPSDNGGTDEGAATDTAGGETDAGMDDATQ